MAHLEIQNDVRCQNDSPRRRHHHNHADHLMMDPYHHEQVPPRTQIDKKQIKVKYWTWSKKGFEAGTAQYP